MGFLGGMLFFFPNSGVGGLLLFGWVPGYGGCCWPFCGVFNVSNGAFPRGWHLLLFAWSFYICLFCCVCPFFVFLGWAGRFSLNRCSPKALQSAGLVFLFSPGGGWVGVLAISGIFHFLEGEAPQGRPLLSLCGFIVYDLERAAGLCRKPSFFLI